MVIAKGEEWGERVRQSDVVYTRNDHDVLTLLASPIKGDIARTIGNDKRKPSIAEKLKTDGAWHQLPFDVIEADVNGASLRAAAHIRVGHFLWGECHLFCNVAIFRGRRVFQKSHPNDAKIEVLTIAREMKLRQRLLAVMRVRKGSHLPHPHLKIWQTTAEDMHFQRPLPIFVDGVKVAMADTLGISVIPDAINIYIASDQE
jgi:hypothetical protein